MWGCWNRYEKDKIPSNILIIFFLKFFFSKNSLRGLHVISVAGEEGKEGEEGKCEEDAQIANKE